MANGESQTYFLFKNVLLYRCFNETINEAHAFLISFRFGVEMIEKRENFWNFKEKMENFVAGWVESCFN